MASNTTDTFQCLTCDERKDAQEMMKHLSASRHKTIVYSPTEEEVCCEECQNNNIHLLQIIRFGGEDMSLLCTSCFFRDYTDSERPSTAYSLSNGSILKNWNKYTTVRDCCCQQCGNESKLNVNPSRTVLCDKCLSQRSSVKGFISEADGAFLYTLLGIQEQSNSAKLKKKGGRKVGRGARKDQDQSRSKSSREKKPLTRLEEMAKKAYETKKINSKIKSETNLSLRSFQGIKAKNSNVSSNVHAPISTKQIKKTDNSRSKSTGMAGSNTKTSNASSGSKGSGRSFGSKASTPLSPKSHSAKKDGSMRTPGQKIGQRGEPRCEPRGNIASKKNGNSTKPGKDIFRNDSIPSDKTLKIAEGLTKSHDRNKLKPRNADSIQRTKPNSRFSSEDSKVDGNHTKGTRRANEIGNGKNKRTTKNDKFPKSPMPNTSNQKKAETMSKGKSNSGALSATIAKEPRQENKDTITAVSEDVEDFEEGEPLKRFTKYVPKMAYPDLESYFSDFSFALFLEERLENDFLQNFEITWPKKPSEKAFIVRMRLDDEEVKRLLPPNLVKLGRLPFTNQQPLMLASQDESKVWYTFVKELDVRKSFVTLLLELYPWNKLDLPVKQTNDHFKLLPCSAQVNRIMFAMTRVDNPKFVKLILGNEPIKQLYFKNRLQFTKDTFNESQKAAIQHVLNNSITVLQGPPGTGKTSTIEEIILQLIENFHTFPVLCVAASNIAIDNIAEKFMENRPDIKILRIVSQSKEQQYNDQHMLGKICLHNIVYQQIPFDMKQNLSKLRSGMPGAVSKNQYNKLLTTQNTISDRHIAQAQIIFTTNIAAGGRQLKAIKELPVVIMDESTQSSEVSTLVPLSLPGIRRFVFVGDEKQLSSFSNVPQLEMSLFERVLSNGTYVKPHMLDTQYRMHPAISEFPVKTFYDGKLKDGVTAEDRKWPGLNYPLFFYQCNDGPENRVFNRKRGMRGFTYNNHHEAEAIIRILHNLILDKNVPKEEIGVITPYSSQRDLISEMLVKDPIVNPSGEAMEQQLDKDDVIGNGGISAESSKITINIINGVYVATVDSFQGHEKNFIIFSCVRNNPEGNIGFLKDRRRLNVALTRARNGLVVVGNQEVLKEGDQLWSDYVSYLTDKDVISSDLSVY